jgi:hypothetical protein
LKYGEIEDKWRTYVTPHAETAQRVALHPIIESGLFSLRLERNDGATVAVMNRSEFAALHAAMGELLRFYGDAP